LPSADLGPVLSRELAWFAATWASVDKIGLLERKNEKARDAFERFRLARTSIKEPCKRFVVKCRGMREMSFVNGIARRRMFEQNIQLKKEFQSMQGTRRAIRALTVEPADVIR
jgi:hypothetical protein